MPWSGFSYNWRHDTDNSVFVGSRPANRVCRTARHWFHADNCFHTCPSSNNRYSVPAYAHSSPRRIGGPGLCLQAFPGRRPVGKAGSPAVRAGWEADCSEFLGEVLRAMLDWTEEYSGELILLGIDVGQFTGLGSPKDAGRLLGSLGVILGRAYPAWHRRRPIHRPWFSQGCR